MLDRMGERELLEWMAFSQIEPIGDDREDLRMGMMCTAIMAAAGAKKENGDQFGLADFIIDFWKQAEPEEVKSASWRRNKEIAVLATIALGGQDLRANNVQPA